MIDTYHYPNGSDEAILDQIRRDENMQKYENIDIQLNWRAYDAVSKNNVIQYVDARHTSTGERIRFEAPLFVDSTGDGWIGYWAGAEYSYGRESKYKYGEEWDKWGELWSPEEPDNAVMGSSILFQTVQDNQANSFPKWQLSRANQRAQQPMARYTLHLILKFAPSTSIKRHSRPSVNVEMSKITQCALLSTPS